MAVPEIDQGPGNNTWESSKFTVSAAYVDDVTYYSSYVYSYSATSAPRDTQLWTFGSPVENHWANIGASDALSVAIGRSDGNITSYNIYPTEVATNPTITGGILYIDVPYNTRLLVTVNGDHANALSLFSSPLKDSIPGTKTDWSTLSKTVTNVDTTNDVVEIAGGHGISVGNVDRVVFHSTGDMFEGVGLSANEPVYVSAIDATSVAVYQNDYKNAGSQVDIVSGARSTLTSAGTGTITMTPVDWYNTTSTLYFPSGEHWIGKSFRLGNDVDVYIDSGAVLVGGFGLRHNTDGPLTTSYTPATGVTIRGAGNLLGKYVAFSQLPSNYNQKLSYSMFDGISYGNNSLKNITVACAPYFFGQGGFSELLNCKFISPTENQGVGITGNNYGAALGVISSCYSFASENAAKADYVSDGISIYDSFLLATAGYCYFGGDTALYGKINTTRKEIPVRNCTFMNIAWPAADIELMRTQTSTNAYKQIGSRGIVGITTDYSSPNDGFWNGKVSFSSCVVNEAVSNRSSSGIPRVFVLGNVPYIYGPRELYGSTKEVTVDDFTINGSPVQKSLVASFNGAETPSGLTFTNVNVDGTVVTDNNYWDYFEFKNTYNKEIGISYAKDVSFDPVGIQTDPGPGVNGWESSLYKVSATDGIGAIFSSFVYSFSSYNQRYQLWAEKYNNYGNDPSDWTDGEHWVDIGTVQDVGCFVIIGREDLSISSISIWPKNVVEYSDVDNLYPGKALIAVPHNKRIRVEVNGDPTTALHIFTSPTETKPNNLVSIGNYTYDVSSVDTLGDTVSISYGHGMTPGDIQRVVFHSDGELFGTSPAMGYNSTLSANEIIWASAVDDTKLALYNSEMTQTADIYNTSAVYFISGTALDITSTGTGNITMLKPDWNDTANTLYFHRGEHWAGKLFRLNEDCKVYLDRGSVVQGSFDIRPYEPDGIHLSGYSGGNPYSYRNNGIEIYGKGILANSYRGRKDTIPLTFPGFKEFQVNLTENALLGLATNDSSVRGITVVTPAFYLDLAIHEFINVKYFNPYQVNADGFRATIDNSQNAGVISACFALAGDDAFSETRGTNITDSFLTTSDNSIINIKYWPGYSQSEVQYKAPLIVKNCDFLHGGFSTYDPTNPWIDRDIFQTPAGDIGEAIGTDAIISCLTDGAEGEEESWNGSAVISSCRVWNPSSDGSIRRPLVLGNVRYPFVGINALNQRDQRGQVSSIVLDSVWFESKPAMNAIMVSYDASSTPHDIQFNNVSAGNTVIDENNYFNYVDFRNTRNQDIGRSYARDVTFNPVGLYVDPGPGLGDRWQSGLYEVSATADFQNVYSAFVYSFSSYNMRRSLWHGPSNWNNGSDPSTWTDGVHWVDLGTSSQVTAVIARKDLAISSVEIWPKEPAVTYSVSTPGYEGKALIVMPQNTRLRIEVNGDHKTAISIFTSPIQQKPDNVISINNFLYDVSTVNVGASTVTVPDHGITTGDIQRVVFHSDGEMFGTDPLPGFNSSAISANEIIWASAINDSDLALYRANWLETLVSPYEGYSVSGERLNITSTGSGNITMIKTDWSNTENPLYFNRGEHWVGRLFRLSNDTNVYIDRGSVAEMSFDLRPYEGEHLAGHDSSVWGQRLSGITIEGPGTVANDFAERKDLPDYTSTSLGFRDLFQGQLTNTAFRGRVPSNIVLKGFTLAKIPFYTSLGVNKHINVKLFNPFIYNGDGLRSGANTFDNTAGLVSACYTLAGDDAVFIAQTRGVDIVDSFITTTSNSCLQGSYWPELYDGDLQFYTSSTVDNCDFLHGYYDENAFGFPDSGSLQNTAGSVADPIGNNSVIKWLTDGWDEVNAPVTGYGSGGQESWWVGDTKITNCRIWAPSGEGSIIRPLILGNVQYPFQGAENATGRRQLRGSVSGIDISGLTFENTPAQNILIVSFDAVSGTPHDISLRDVNIGGTLIDSSNYETFIDFIDTSEVDIGYGEVGSIAYNFTFDQYTGDIQKELGEILINMSLPRAPNADSLN